MDFKVGTHKKYVIKDLLEFARLVREHELFQYGKNLKFFHEPESFTPESRKLLSFIMQRIEEYEYHFRYVQDSTYRFQTIKPLRELPLSPTAIDTFLNLMLGRTLQFRLAIKPRRFVSLIVIHYSRYRLNPRITAHTN